jgi:prepilin-type N-terminal cleavage/methylation domain-containing protein
LRRTSPLFRCTAREARRAVTLLEIMVALVVIAIGATVVAPTLSPARTSGTVESLALLRDRAARRGQPIDTAIAGRTLRIMPNGACLTLGPAEGAARWDPARCRMTATP